jgi:hypothetical protein
MSLEMAHKVILPPKKNYIPQFLKQRDINSYYGPELFYLTIGLKNVQYRTISNAILIGSNTSYWNRNGARTLLSDPTKIIKPDKKT